MEKMTNAKAIAYVLDNFTAMPDEVAEKLKKMLLQTEKKSTNKKPTATQTVNEEYKQIILNTMRENPDRLFTITELIKEIPELYDLTNQRVSALVRSLIENHLVTRVKEKRISNFRLFKDGDITEE